MVARRAGTRDHLAQVTDEQMPPGTLGNADAAYRVAELVEAGAGNGLREEFITSRYGSVRAASTTPRRASTWPATRTPRRSPPSRRDWSDPCSIRW
jgi:hypothetical protein